MSWRPCECESLGVFVTDRGIERCDLCKRFETDDDAAACVRALLKIADAHAWLMNVATVADALDSLEASLPSVGAIVRREA